MRLLNRELSSTICFIVASMLSVPNAECQIRFTSTYQGKAVTGLVGSSVNFTWSYSAVRLFDWGIKQINGGALTMKLVSIDQLGTVTFLSSPGSDYDGRVNGIRIGDTSTGQVIFTLSNIKKTDAKLYGCAIYPLTPGQLLFDEVNLRVEELPHIVHPNVSQTTYNEGGRVSISCEATGTPKPDVTWIGIGSGFRGAQLTFSSISRADAGIYTCRANNSVGTKEKQLTVVVNYAAIITSISSSLSMSWRGQVVSIRCVSDGVPTPTLSWYAPGGTRFNPVTGKENMVYVTMNSDDDFGLYNCTADNGFAPVSRTVRVQQIKKPHITHPNFTQTHYNEGERVNISCEATGTPKPDVTWIRNGQVKSSGFRTAQLTFSSISRSDAGTYMCRANNSVGTKENQLTVVVNYAATIRSIFSSSSKSWIGQTVTMRCESDGFPTPVLTWYSPGGNRFTPVRDKENTVHVPMSSGKDFGLYICTADNGFVPASQTVRVQQIKAPGSPSITSTAADVHATSLTVKWTEPTDDGGSPVTAYRVVILHGRNVTSKINITDPAAREFFFGGLNRNTYYNVTAYARNFVFEGEMSQATMKTKFAGVPFATDITCLPVKTKETNVTIQWNEANNNGAPIVRYTLYQRSVSVDSITQDWGKVSEKRDPLARQVAVQLERGKEYKFFVTATNAFGESLREDTKIANITVLGDVPGSITMSAEVMHDEITLKWEEPENNGAAIIHYSVYQRTGNDQRWRKLEDLLDIAKREYVVSMQKNKAYEFVVTATNKYGEGPKGSVTVVLILGGTNNPQEKKSGVLGSSHNLDAAYISLITVLVIVIIILSVLLWRLRHRPCPRCAGELIAMNPLALPVGDNTEHPSVAKTAAAVTCATPAKGDYMPLHPSGRSWEISREQVDIIKVIGKGAFSQVAQGKVGDLRGNQENTIVAIKMLKANAPQSDRKDLLSELELMKKLKPHPHVIKLMGCVTWSDPLMVLIEYVPFGDLLGYLRKSRGLNDTYYKDPDVKPQTSLTAEQLMKFARQVADGMCYLSSKKIIHRDLAARNVLVGEGEMCKVTDFGMARNVHQDDIYTRKSRGRLPVKWTAYEALLYGTYTTQSDVWSYGVLLYEILTVGGSPYPTIKAREIAAKIQEGYRMPKPSHVDEKLYRIMLRCWEENPDERPTFEKLRKTMKDLERNHMTYVNLTQYDDSLYTNITDFADD